MGVKVAHRPEADNVGGAAVVVVSSAIKRDNPELVAARDAARSRRPSRRDAGRKDAFEERSRSAAPMQNHRDDAGRDAARRRHLDPTVINGGIINAYGTNARLGGGEWMVVDADENDGTFLKLPTDVAIVTNVDPEHLDHFRTFEAIQQAFRHFVENLPFYGFAVMCIDHPVVQSTGRQDRGSARHHLRREPAGRCAAGRPHSDGGGSKFAVAFRDRMTVVSRDRRAQCDARRTTP